MDRAARRLCGTLKDSAQMQKESKMKIFICLISPLAQTLAAYNPLTSQPNPVQDVLQRATNGTEFLRVVERGLGAPSVAYRVK